ncbi:hypothetical protein B0H13DRAFT_1904025 [Mycena leptocephala]|nr:hypothetical protein B0H13DRAFT_1904025 [Mycena leptocephala]
MSDVRRYSGWAAFDIELESPKFIHISSSNHWLSGCHPCRYGHGRGKTARRMVELFLDGTARSTARPAVKRVYGIIWSPLPPELHLWVLDSCSTQLTRFEAPLSFSASAVGAPKAQLQSSQEIKMAMVHKQCIGEDMKAIQSRIPLKEGIWPRKLAYLLNGRDGRVSRAVKLPKKIATERARHSLHGCRRTVATATGGSPT